MSLKNVLKLSWLLGLLIVLCQSSSTQVPPFRELARMFDYDHRAPLDVKENSVEEREGAKIYDIMVLMIVFASAGLALVTLGVFSIIAYTVARQTHEIGIRMALGAGHADVVWMILRRGLQLIGLGVVVGLLASFAVTRVIANQLWEVSPRDPLTLGAAVAVVALAGLAACYFPARRATRVDPLVALRVE